MSVIGGTERSDWETCEAHYGLDDPGVHRYTCDHGLWDGQHCGQPAQWTATYEARRVRHDTWWLCDYHMRLTTAQAPNTAAVDAMRELLAELEV